MKIILAETERGEPIAAFKTLEEVGTVLSREPIRFFEVEINEQSLFDGLNCSLHGDVYWPVVTKIKEVFPNK